MRACVGLWLDVCLPLFLSFAHSFVRPSGWRKEEPRIGRKRTSPFCFFFEKLFSSLLLLRSIRVRDLFPDMSVSCSLFMLPYENPSPFPCSCARTYPQYPPRIILIVRNTAGTIPPAGLGIEPGVRLLAVGGRRGFRLAHVAAAHEVGDLVLALVFFLGLLALLMADPEHDSGDDGCGGEDADDDAGGYPGYVRAASVAAGFRVFGWTVGCGCVGYLGCGLCDYNG